MSLEPKAGLVICYDFLWKEEAKLGQDQGMKNRPCAVVLASQIKDDNSRDVIVCPVTHSLPKKGETSVEIPRKVAQHLNLDHQRMWIKTHQVNKIKWQNGIIPYGVSRTPQGAWSHGVMPYALREKVLQQVRENSRNRLIGIVSRDA